MSMVNGRSASAEPRSASCGERPAFTDLLLGQMPHESAAENDEVNAAIATVLRCWLAEDSS